MKQSFFFNHELTFHNGHRDIDIKVNQGLVNSGKELAENNVIYHREGMVSNTIKLENENRRNLLLMNTSVHNLFFSSCRGRVEIVWT